jgi:aryl-alcohol dehydrogenase-like predicted oxidoreductase
VGNVYVLPMRFRTYKDTDLTVSEVGFGLWTISTGWWGNFTEGEAIALMHQAFDLGVTLFDAADTDAYNTSRL